MKRPVILVLYIVFTLFVIAVVALGTIASSKVYFLREDSGGTLYSKGDEAYLFMNATRRGYHFTYLEFPWMVLKQYLNAPPFPDDRRVADIVIQVTPSAVERQIVDFGEETGGSPPLPNPIRRWLLRTVSRSDSLQVDRQRFCAGDGRGTAET